MSHRLSTVTKFWEDWEVMITMIYLCFNKLVYQTVAFLLASSLVLKAS